MLIPFGDIVKKYRIQGGKILHIGAHRCEERIEYKKYGWDDDSVIWIEGNPELYSEVKRSNPSLNLYHGIISDKDDDMVEFIITNNLQSSSILPLEQSKTEQPWIFETKRIHIPTTTVSTILNRANISKDDIRFCNINIQGGELMALRGMGDYISNIKYVYIRVYERHLYKDCPLVHDIDSYMTISGFSRKDINMSEHGWGDALYINEKPKVSAVLRGGMGNRFFILAAMMGYSHKNPIHEPVILRSKYEPFYQAHQKVNMDVFIRNIPIQDDMPIGRMFIEQSGYDAQFRDINEGMTINGNLLLDGYFQHEKYFEGVEHWIETQFGCPLDVQHFIERAYPDIHNGCFIHVRRTDTLHLPYPDLTEYYNKSINTFPTDTVFFIFSDDLEWCKSNMIIYNSRCIFVDEEAIACLWIMSLCRRGGIAAISTYSWWAGWLNKRRFRDSKVFCPKCIFNPSSTLFNMIDV